MQQLFSIVAKSLINEKCGTGFLRKRKYELAGITLLGISGIRTNYYPCGNKSQPTKDSFYCLTCSQLHLKQSSFTLINRRYNENFNLGMTNKVYTSL